MFSNIFVHTKNACFTKEWNSSFDPPLHPLFYGSHKDFKKQLSWIDLTHVCIYWRYVAPLQHVSRLETFVVKLNEATNLPLLQQIFDDVT